MSTNDHNWTMPSAYLGVFLQHAASENLPLAPLLEGTGIEIDGLSQSNQPVLFNDMRRVLANVTCLLGPGWHLSLGERLTVASHGPLGFAVVTAPDVRAAVDVLLRYFGIRGPFLWSTGSLEEEQFVIRFFEATELGAERALLVELAALSVQALIERPLGHSLKGAMIAFSHDAPVYREQLENAFHARLSFGAQRHSLRFPAGWLDQHCALQDEAMHRYLLGRCKEEMLQATGSLPAEVAVRQALLANPGQWPALEEIAASQNVSPRTLIRRLKRGNSSYREILENVRRTLASDYLLNTDMSTSVIAYRLGYQDPSNFGRAFRAWFGMPPGEYRRKSG